MNDFAGRLQSKDETDRLFAVQDLSDSEDPHVVPLLIARLGVEPSQIVRGSIVSALRRMDCSAAHDLLFHLFRSHDAFLRNEAVVIFGSEGEKAVSYLTSHLNDSEAEVRKLTLDALFLTGTVNARLAVRAGLSDPSPNVRITAVEYLGRLGDRESVHEMVELFGNEEEPMLRASILEALSAICSGDVIRKVISILAPHGAIDKVDPVYLPPLINLVAKGGDREEILMMLTSVVNTRVYGDDIIRALGEVKRRFKESLDGEEILEKVLSIAEDEGEREEVRFAAVEYLLRDRLRFSERERMYRLGCRLLPIEGMAFAGVRLLGDSGKEEGAEKIREVLARTEDEDLRAICEEVLSKNLKTETGESTVPLPAADAH